MNFNAVNVTMFGVGAILIYCAIKDKNPKDVVTDAFSASKQTNKNAGKHPRAKSGSHNAADSAVNPDGTGTGAGLSFAQPFPVTSN